MISGNSMALKEGKLKCFQQWFINLWFNLLCLLYFKIILDEEAINLQYRKLFFLRKKDLNDLISLNHQILFSCITHHWINKPPKFTFLPPLPNLDSEILSQSVSLDLVAYSSSSRCCSKHGKKLFCQQTHINNSALFTLACQEWQKHIKQW